MELNLECIDEINKLFKLEGYKGLLGKKSLWLSIMLFYRKISKMHRTMLFIIKHNSQSRMDYLIGLSNREALWAHNAKLREKYQRYYDSRNAANQDYYNWVNSMMNRGR